MRTIIVEKPERLRSGKTALLGPVTNYDHAEYSGKWHPVNLLPIATRVDAVNHFGRHISRVNDIVAVEAYGENVSDLHIRIDAIWLIHTTQLTDEQAQAVGYTSAAAAVAVVGERRMWLMQIQCVSIQPMLY